MSLDLHPTDDLAAYALGALDDDETVAAHVARCAVCTREVAELHEALYEAAAVGAAAVDPPRTLRARIVLRHRGAPAGHTRGWGARLRDFLTRPVPLAAPAALALVLAVAFAALGGARAEADAYARALAGVADGRVVALAPSAENPDARGSLVIPAQGTPYLVLRLRTPPSGKAWQAWVLRPSPSGPVAVGAGAANAGGVFTLVLTAPLGAGDGVAITLEAAAGAAQPTTQPVLAVART